MITQQKALVVTDAPASISELNGHLTSSDHWLVKSMCPMPSSRSAHAGHAGGQTHWYGEADIQVTNPTCLVILERTVES